MRTIIVILSLILTTVATKGIAGDNSFDASFDDFVDERLQHNNVPDEQHNNVPDEQPNMPPQITPNMPEEKLTKREKVVKDDPKPKPKPKDRQNFIDKESPSDCLVYFWESMVINPMHIIYVTRVKYNDKLPKNKYYITVKLTDNDSWTISSDTKKRMEWKRKQILETLSIYLRGK